MNLVDAETTSKTKMAAAGCTLLRDCAPAKKLPLKCMRNGSLYRDIRKRDIGLLNVNCLYTKKKFGVEFPMKQFSLSNTHSTSN